MQKAIFLVIWLSLVSFLVKAQEFSNQVWHDGYVVTTNDDTIRGQIKYDMEANIVQLIKNNTVKTLSSHKIFYFEIFDKIVQNYRQFYSIPSSVSYDYKIPIIFEVLYEGPLSLLSRESIVRETMSTNSPYWSGGTYIRDRVAYTFFFLDKEGNMARYTGKKSDLYQIMGRKSRQVKEFIKKNKLKTDEVRDLIRITAFYNSI